MRYGNFPKRLLRETANENFYLSMLPQEIRVIGKSKGNRNRTGSAHEIQSDSTRKRFRVMWDDGVEETCAKNAFDFVRNLETAPAVVPLRETILTEIAFGDIQEGMGDVDSDSDDDNDAYFDDTITGYLLYAKYQPLYLL
jgi:hypothetical protein